MKPPIFKNALVNCIRYFRPEMAKYFIVFTFKDEKFKFKDYAQLLQDGETEVSIKRVIQTSQLQKIFVRT